MNTHDPHLDSLIRKARLAGEELPGPSYGFSTRVAALGLQALQEKGRTLLAWKLALLSLLPAAACLAFLLVGQGSIRDIWTPDSNLSSLETELYLP